MPWGKCEASDSSHGLLPCDTLDHAQKSLFVTVSPDSAKDAYVTIVRKGIIVDKPEAFTRTFILPETLGVLKPPLSICLSLGVYDIIAKGDGFRETKRELEVDKSQQYVVSLEMPSLEYLRSKRHQWATSKWIGVGLFAAAGIASVYYDIRVREYAHDYHNSSSPGEIPDLRDRIRTNQSRYTVFSAIALSALGSAVLSWLIELSYRTQWTTQ